MVQATSIVDLATRRYVVEQIADNLEKRYVFPEVGRAMRDMLQQRLDERTYDSLDDPVQFSDALSDDIQAISHNKHLRLRYLDIPKATQPDEGDSSEVSAEDIEEAQRENYGFYNVDRLAGNIGYLDIRTLWDAGFPGAGEMGNAAMTLLANTDALIIDLRKNGGGAPTMVALLTCYLFGPEPVHLNSFYQRADDKLSQFWTYAHVQGKRTPNKPVYVLTSNFTFSGAEEFAYNLKILKRATIVGETTGGGANPGSFLNVTPHFRIFIPTGRAVNPTTGTNWEGTGVEPDIAVPADQALDRAYQLALEGVQVKLENARTRSARDQASEIAEALAKLSGSTTGSNSYS